MARIAQLREIPTPRRSQAFGMPVLLAIFALAVLGLSLLAKPADRADPHPVQETATTPHQQDWHGNYNIVRR